MTRVLQARFPAHAARLFQRVFCFKIALFGALHHYPRAASDLAALCALVAATALVLHGRYARLGVTVLFAHRAGTAFTALPFTLNHAFFESWVLLFLLLFPSGPADERGEVDGLAPSLVRATTLSVWFYAGVQKIVHGRYLDGEMLAVSGLLDGGKMVSSLTPAVRTLAGATGVAVGDLPLHWPASYEASELAIPGLALGFVLASSWVVVLGELLLPALVLRGGRAGKPALLALIALQIVIALLSAELSFGVTSAAALLLFAPEWARRGYPVLAVAIVASWLAIVGGLR